MGLVGSEKSRNWYHIRPRIRKKWPDFTQSYQCHTPKVAHQGFMIQAFGSFWDILERIKTLVDIFPQAASSPNSSVGGSTPRSLTTSCQLRPKLSWCWWSCRKIPGVRCPEVCTVRTPAFGSHLLLHENQHVFIGMPSTNQYFANFSTWDEIIETYRNSSERSLISVNPL